MTPWQKILRTNLRSTEELCDFLELQPSQRKIIIEKKRFGLNVPLRLAKKMTKGSITDPLFLQFVPIEKELFIGHGCKKDPVDDKAFVKAPKLLVKYPGRALLLVSSACAMHCRYCFRQHFDYAIKGGFSEELAYIAKDLSLKEVILSGGDPLSLPNPLLQSLIEEIAAFPHITRLRFHSRFPIGIPERIDDGFLDILRKTRLQVYFVLHSNHSSEIDEDVRTAVKRLMKEGAVVLNQAVLLKGVNDSVQELEALIEKCVDVGIIPYYLHQLDCVQGASHFGVAQEDGKRLIEEMRGRVSGFGLFRYVEEVPHRQSKTALI